MSSSTENLSSAARAKSAVLEPQDLKGKKLFANAQICLIDLKYSLRVSTVWNRYEEWKEYPWRNISEDHTVRLLEQHNEVCKNYENNQEVIKGHAN